jgi:hypothetical protein
VGCYVGRTAIFEDSCSPSPSYCHRCASFFYILIPIGEVTDPIVPAGSLVIRRSSG